MKKLLLLLLSFSAFVSTAQVRFYDVKTLSNYQQVLEKSIKEDKIMFIAFYRNGDAFYQMQKDNIFSDARLDSIYTQNAINLAVSITSEMGSRIAESIGVDSFPTFYYFDKNETLLLVKEGYQTKTDLAESFYKVQKINAAYEDLKDKYSASTLSDKEWRMLIEIYALNNDFIETKALALEYFNSRDKSALLVPANAGLVEKYGVDLETEYPKTIIANKQKLGTSFDFEAFYIGAYDFNFDLASANDDTVLLQKIVTELLPNRPKDEANTQELAFETQKVFASETRNFGVWQRAASKLSKTMADDSIKAEFLFGEAFEIADNFNSENAQRAARNLAEEAYNIKADFRYKMLEGYMAYLMNDYDAAKKLVALAESQTDNANNKRKAISLLKMIEKEISKESQTEDQ